MTWHDDGSDSIKAEANEFTVSGKKSSGTPSNARFGTAVTPESGYFEVEVLDLGADSCFIGVGTEEGFKEGWRCKGLFFGGPGNTSSGGALVKGSYGDAITKGMKVGVLVEFIDEPEKKVHVTFYQDGRCLGPAFSSKRCDPAADVYPVVHTNSEGDRFKITFPTSTPSEARRTREPKPKEQGSHDAEGTWTVVALRVGPELHDFPLEAKDFDDKLVPVVVTLQVGPDGAEKGRFRLSCKVGNTLNLRIAASGEVVEGFEKISNVGALMSTMMMTPFNVVEQQFAGFLEALQKWHVGKDDKGVMKLLLRDTAGAEMELAFSPDVGPPVATDVDLP